MVSVHFVTVVMIVVVLVLVFRLRTASWADVGRDELAAEVVAVFLCSEFDPDFAYASDFCSSPLSNCLLNGPSISNSEV